MTGNDDFFGGSVTPPTPPASGGVNPHLAHTKEYGSFGTPSPHTPKAGSSNLPLVVGIIAALGVLVLGFLGYRMYFGPKIVLPDELMGYERIDPESDLGKTFEESWTQLEDLGDGIDLQVGAYPSGQKMLFVIAGDEGSKADTDVDDFFAGMSESMRSQLPGATLREEEAGAAGGTMRCFEVAQSGTNAGACAWLAEETVGIVIAAPVEGDIAEMTREVRTEIEK